MGKVEGTVKRLKYNPGTEGVTVEMERKGREKKCFFKGEPDRTWKLTRYKNEQDDTKMPLSLCGWKHDITVNRKRKTCF